MGFSITVLLLAGFWAGLCPALWADGLSSNEIQAHAHGKVFQLMTKVTKGTEKQSYGTAFAVDPKGLLLTNYHVVANSILKPHEYVLELKMGNESMPAKVIALDVPNDLAIVQVDRVFPEAYRFSETLPAPGEKLFSIGVPEDTVMTIIEGLFSDIRRSDPVTRLLFSAPLNHGMSGGPVLNAKEEIIGVNDAMLQQAQNISLACPAEAASKLLKSVGEPGRSPASVIDKTILGAQAEPVLRAWVQSWESAQASSGGPRFGGIQLSNPPPGSKCWQDEEKKSGPMGNVGIFICQTQDTFPLSEKKSGGQVSLRYYWLSNDAKKAGAFEPIFDHNFSVSLKGRAAAAFAKWTRTSDERVNYVCHHRYVVNSHSENILAEFCVTQSVNGSNLFDAVLTAIPLSEDGKFFGEMQLGGFTEDTLKAASGAFLSSIQSVSDRGDAQ
jgi:serine protease Do